MKIQDNILKIDMTRAFSNKRINFKAMTEADRLQYALSFLGIKPKGLDLPKIKADNKIKNVLDNRITTRNKNFFFNIMRDACKIGHHSPRENVKYFGVEIECLIPFDSISICKDDYSTCGTHECSDCEGSGRIILSHRDSGQEMEVECQYCDGSGEIESDDSDDTSELFSACKNKLASKIKSLNIRGIDIKEDGSLDAEDESDELWPVELTCLVRQDDMSSLNKLCTLLNELGAKVNSTCGLHVHIDARHLSKGQVQRIGTKFSHALPFMGQVVPKSRTTSRFCKMKVSNFSDDRYCAVNLTAFEKYRTIEIRLHSSTTSFLKISNWIKMLSLITEAKMGKLESMTTLQDFFKVIKADDSLQNYIISRVAKFRGTAEETPCEADTTEDESQIEIGA